MFDKKIILSVSIFLLLSSCGGTWDSVKRGLTGQKQKSTDEFLVEKKDPLILPPNFDELPTPGDRETAVQVISELEKSLGKTDTSENKSPQSSTEQSILQQIRKQ